MFQASSLLEYASEVLKLRKENDLERLVDVLVRAASRLIGERMGQRVRWLKLEQPERPVDTKEQH